MWTWVAGFQNFSKPQFNQIGSSGNPGSLYGACGWVTEQNELLLFGGLNHDAFSNNIWKFNGNEWIWIFGPGPQPFGGNYGQLGVTSASNLPPERSYSTCWKKFKNSTEYWMFGGETGSK